MDIQSYFVSLLEYFGKFFKMLTLLVVLRVLKTVRSHFYIEMTKDALPGSILALTLVVVT